MRQAADFAIPAPARMARLLVLVALSACAVRAQPVVGSRAVGPAPLAVEVGPDVLVLARGGEWRAPPGLYWTGVALDVTVLAAGTYGVVLGAQLLAASDDPDVGAGAFAGAIFGPFVIAVGGLMAGASLYDLIRVLTGADPALAHLFDPTRPLPGSRPYPFP